MKKKYYYLILALIYYLQNNSTIAKNNVKGLYLNFNSTTGKRLNEAINIANKTEAAFFS